MTARRMRRRPARAAGYRAYWADGGLGDDFEPAGGGVALTDRLGDPEAAFLEGALRLADVRRRLGLWGPGELYVADGAGLPPPLEALARELRGHFDAPPAPVVRAVYTPVLTGRPVRLSGWHATVAGAIEEAVPGLAPLGGGDLVLLDERGRAVPTRGG